MSNNDTKVAIIGGGIAGSTTALLLAHAGLEVTLFEKEESIVNGPPFCHLHAGGNLYPDISDAQCLTLLRQSIDFMKLYPEGIEYRPTILALPQGYSQTPHALLPRLEKLRHYYRELVETNPDNRLLGDANEYFICYDKEAIEALAQTDVAPPPHSMDAWMVPFAKSVDRDTIQFPVIMVQEYGLNLFRIAASLMLQLQAHPKVTLKCATAVEEVSYSHSQWEIATTTKERDSFDYLINATGYQTGHIDTMIGLSCKRMVEFKAAYVSHWKRDDAFLWPEIIFHGERGTPRGMAQFTPYHGGYVQLHGMTQEITLYVEGLVEATPPYAHLSLAPHFITKLEGVWRWEEVLQRTQRAIGYVSHYIPQFHKATVASKPLFGAQQIPGDDPALRVAEVTFSHPHYARCEIVKVSSVVDMVKAILENLYHSNLLSSCPSIAQLRANIQPFASKEIYATATQLALQRGYPTSMIYPYNKSKGF